MTVQPDDRPHVPLDQQARAGVGVLPGMVWRSGDGAKHLGPPEGLMEPWHQTFSTRCGLGPADGPWEYTKDADDVWCAACLQQGGVPHVMWDAWEAENDPENAL